MSLATRQAKFMLSMVNGVLKLLADEPAVPKEIAPTILWADEFCWDLLDRYPETGDPVKNGLWMKRSLAEFDRIGADKIIRWHPGVVSTFALNFLEDILEKINNSARQDVGILRDGLARISYFFTDGEEDLIFDEANQVTAEVYGIIGFSR